MRWFSVGFSLPLQFVIRIGGRFLVRNHRVETQMAQGGLS